MERPKLKRSSPHWRQRRNQPTLHDNIGNDTVQTQSTPTVGATA
jgi:hypothetical protein